MHTHWPARTRTSALLAAGLLCLASLPAAAQTVGTDMLGCTTPPEDTIHLDVSNPGPGDTVPIGNMVIHGVAFDRSAQTGNGIDRVALFLESRDAAGLHLADATLGLPNPDAAPNSIDAMAGWQATITVPNSPGGRNLVVHAHSGVSDHESVVSIPFMLAQDSQSGQQCTSSTTAGTSAVISPAASIHLELSNPQPQDTVKVGSLVLQGVAFDHAAMSGTGIDRVSLFLDNRDEGGLHLADATLTIPGVMPDTMHGLFQTTVSMPDEIGGHTLFVYAHSSVTGHDNVLSVPIQVKQ